LNNILTSSMASSAVTFKNQLTCSDITSHSLLRSCNKGQSSDGSDGGVPCLLELWNLNDLSVHSWGLKFLSYRSWSHQLTEEVVFHWNLNSWNLTLLFHLWDGSHINSMV
jgi:hypothetical protein